MKIDCLSSNHSFTEVSKQFRPQEILYFLFSFYYPKFILIFRCKTSGSPSGILHARNMPLRQIMVNGRHSVCTTKMIAYVSININNTKWREQKMRSYGSSSAYEMIQTFSEAKCARAESQSQASTKMYKKCFFFFFIFLFYFKYFLRIYLCFSSQFNVRVFNTVGCIASMQQHLKTIEMFEVKTAKTFRSESFSFLYTFHGCALQQKRMCNFFFLVAAIKRRIAQETKMSCDNIGRAWIQNIFPILFSVATNFSRFGEFWEE